MFLWRKPKEGERLKKRMEGRLARGLKARGSDCVLPDVLSCADEPPARSYRTSLRETPYGSLLIIIAIEDGEQFRDGQQLSYFFGQVK